MRSQILLLWSLYETEGGSALSVDTYFAPMPINQEVDENMNNADFSELHGERKRSVAATSSSSLHWVVIKHPTLFLVKTCIGPTAIPSATAKHTESLLRCTVDLVTFQGLIQVQTSGPHEHIYLVPRSPPDNSRRLDSCCRVFVSSRRCFSLQEGNRINSSDDSTPPLGDSFSQSYVR